MRTSASEHLLRLPTSGSVSPFERLGASGRREAPGEAQRRIQRVRGYVALQAGGVNRGSHRQGRALLFDLERRPARPYDEQGSSHVLVNGTVADTDPLP